MCFLVGMEVHAFCRFDYYRSLQTHSAKLTPQSWCGGDFPDPVFLLHVNSLPLHLPLPRSHATVIMFKLLVTSPLPLD